MTADRLPPYSEEAEQGVLGCILHSPLDCLEQCAAMNVQPDTFYDLRHRSIYEAMVRLIMSVKPIDTITLQQNLKDHGELDNVGGISFLSELPDKTPSASNISHYIDILLQKSVARKTIALCSETASRAFERTPESWLSDFREQVIQLRIGCSVIARPIGELVRPPDNDPTQFFQHRYLCECGGMLINGPTGMGKSSFVLQGYALWSNQMPFFGITPSRPLRAVLIQAENDDGDLAEMRDGICEGLKFTKEQRANFFTRVLVHTSNGTVGRRFCNDVIQPLIISHKPNLIGIDPANSFIGGDTKEQRDVGAFLRTWLNPLLHAHKAAATIVHHTNKPATGKEKPNWKNGELAYTGSGSAEWANWARAVLAIQDTGTHGIYRLHAAKRGVRLHWRNPGSDEPVFEKLIGHATDGHIYWRDADESEIKESTRGPTYEPNTLVDLLSESSLTTTEWCKVAREETGITERTFYRAIKELESSDLVCKSKATKKWSRIIPK